MPLTLGPEFQINVPAQGDKDFTGQAAALLPNGRIVVVWSGPGESGDGDPSEFGHGVRARILNRDGSPAGGEFVVNSTTLNAQDGASVAVLSDGRIVFAWRSNEKGDGGTIENDPCIRARVFNDDGTPALYNGSTEDFVVNTIPGYNQDTPIIGALDNGRFVIGFRSQPAEDFFGDWQVMMRMFTSSGPVGIETSVNQTDGTEFFQSLTVLEDGGFVVAWHDVHVNNSFPGNNGNNIVLRVMNADGSPRTNNFLAATTPTQFPSSSALDQVNVAALSDGGFVAAWTYPRPEPEDGGDGSLTSIRARIFNADGSPRAVNGSLLDFQVNTTSLHDQRRAAVVGLDDGRFLISFWSRSDKDGTAESTILGRLFNADGTPDGVDFYIKEGPSSSFGGTIGQPHDLVRTADGRILDLYDNDPGAFPDIIHGRFLDDNDAPVVTGSLTLAAIAANSGPRLITQEQLLRNVSDPDGPSLVAANLVISSGLGTLVNNNNGTWSYTPALNDDSAVKFSYIVSDGIASPVGATALLDITSASVDNGPAAKNDFNGDHQSDLLLRNISTGAVRADIIDGAYLDESVTVGQLGLEWQIAGTGDFDNDRDADILWRNSNTGDLRADLLQDGRYQSTAIVGRLGLEWQVQGTADFDRDGDADILWRDVNTGQLRADLIQNGQYQSTTTVGRLGLEWQVQGVGDFDRDGDGDVLWRDMNTGQVRVDILQNGEYQSTAITGQLGLEWNVSGVGDFDRDGDTDILWRDSNTGVLRSDLIENGQYQSTANVGQLGLEWQVSNTGDYDHDGDADILWQNLHTSDVRIDLIENGQYQTTSIVEQLTSGWHLA
jgi:hypothetical protein